MYLLLYMNAEIAECKFSESFHDIFYKAVIAQLGERQTEDLKVSGSIPDRGSIFIFFF